MILYWAGIIAAAVLILTHMPAWMAIGTIVLVLVVLGFMMA